MIAAAALTLAFLAGGIWLGLRISRRMGHKSAREISPRLRRLMAVTLLVSFAFAVAVAVSFAAGKPGIGIGLLIALCVLPTLITTPLRIRQSRRAAEAARAARLSSAQHSREDRDPATAPRPERQ